MIWGQKVIVEIKNCVPDSISSKNVRELQSAGVIDMTGTFRNYDGSKTHAWIDCTWSEFTGWYQVEYIKESR